MKKIREGEHEKETDKRKETEPKEYKIREGLKKSMRMNNNDKR